VKELLRNKRMIILAVVICLFAVSLIYRITHPFKQQKVDVLAYSVDKSKRHEGNINKKDIRISSVQEPLIKLDLFMNPPARSREERKNIFSTEEIIDKQGNMSDESKIDKTSNSATTSVENENKVEDDLSSFRSFGYMESKGERVLFIEKGTQIILLRKGDRVEGKYIVKEITKEELTLTVIANNESIYIDLRDL
jgi:hypothetical protein